MTLARLLLVLLISTLTLGCRVPLELSPPTRFIGSEPIAEAPRPELYANTDAGELPHMVPAPHQGFGALPLEHTDVAARVIGDAARVRVRQTFQNPYDRAIEVIYTFPLPQNAAVDGMRMVIGERTVEAEVRRREDAAAIYREAKAAGHTAALLEQERTNIFTHSIANIPAHAQIDVELTYLQTLTLDDGTHEFVFPMVIGPRFMPETEPDAERINPPILGKGERSGHDVSLHLEVEAGAAIERWTAPTHRVVAAARATGFAAELADAETIPNRDFVIRWKPAPQQTQATLYLGPQDALGCGHASLLLVPPELAPETDAPRELIFVVDSSGSMSGVPLMLAKRAVERSLARLRPSDRFNVLTFAGAPDRLFPESRPVTRDNLVAADRFLNRAQSGGGTYMLDAVAAALEGDIGPGDARFVVFLTDGFVGNEHGILAKAAELRRRAEAAGGHSRVFAIGIGSAPNDMLITGLAEVSDAVPLTLRNREPVEPTVETLFRYLDHPILDELAPDWGGLVVDETYPSALPSLLAGRGVTVLGRYCGELDHEVSLRAHVPGRHDSLTVPVSVARSELDGRLLATIWARQKIADLTRRELERELDGELVREQITLLGLEFQLVTAHTSLVAVDSSRVVGDGLPPLVEQPQALPEDVDFELSHGYAMYGYSVSNDRVGTLVQEYIEEIPDDATMLPLGYADWDANSVMRIARVAASEGADLRALRRAIRDRIAEFEACHETHHSKAPRRRLRYRLEFDAGGRLVHVTLLDGSLGEAGELCMEGVFYRVPWRGLPTARAVVEVELAMRLL